MVTSKGGNIRNTKDRLTGARTLKAADGTVGHEVHSTRDVKQRLQRKQQGNERSLHKRSRTGAQQTVPDTFHSGARSIAGAAWRGRTRCVTQALAQ